MTQVVKSEYCSCRGLKLILSTHIREAHSCLLTPTPWCLTLWPQEPADKHTHTHTLKKTYSLTISYRYTLCLDHSYHRLFIFLFGRRSYWIIPWRATQQLFFQKQVVWSDRSGPGSLYELLIHLRLVGDASTVLLSILVRRPQWHVQ